MQLTIEWQKAESSGQWWKTYLRGKTPKPLLPPLYQITAKPSPTGGTETTDLYRKFPGFSLGSRKLPEIEPYRSDYREPVLFIKGVVEIPKDIPIRDLYEPAYTIIVGPGTVAAMAYTLAYYNLAWSQDSEGIILKLPLDLYREMVNGEPVKAN